MHGYIGSIISGGFRIFVRGFRLRRITVIAWIVFIMAGKYVIVYAEAAKSAPIRTKCGKISDLRSHLLAFQAPYNEHWSGGRRNCRICSMQLIASFCSWLVKLTITS